MALIFRAEAVLAMGEALTKAGELLPLLCRDARIFAFNPLRAVRALDEEASSVVRFDSGKIMMVRKYAFISKLIEGVDAFKLTNMQSSPTFVSSRIVDAWQAKGLTGLKFKQVA